MASDDAPTPGMGSGRAMTPTESFLTALHPDAATCFCIWWKSPSQEGWRHFPCTPEGHRDAGTYASSLPAPADVYVSMGQFAAPPAGRGRGDEVVQIHALWAEVDLAGPGHKLKLGEVLPEDATAVQLLEGIKPYPSIIVFSGGGLHLHWLLKTALKTAGPEANEAARRILDGCLERVRRQFRYTDPSGARRPYKVETVSDLARVLRVPGTANYKLAVPRAVQVVWPADLAGAVRYDPKDFAVPPARVAGEGLVPAAAGYVPHGRRHRRAIDNFLDAVRSRKLSVRRKSGRNGYLVECPGPSHGAKGDRHPSLDVDVASDRILVKCWAGCELDQVLRALGLERSDLFDPGTSGRTKTFLVGDADDAEPPVWVLPQHEQFRRNLSGCLLQAAAQQLHLSAQALLRLGLGYQLPEEGVLLGRWTWPMYRPDRRIVGIQLRDPVTGAKITLKDTHLGLFLPEELDPPGQLLVTEGPTDCCAALDLGYAAIGRASCSSCNQYVVEFIGRHSPASVVIVADRDVHQAGLRGAAHLARQLVSERPDLRVILPPANAKDLRGWLHGGASRADVDERIRQARPVSTGIA